MTKIYQLTKSTQCFHSLHLHWVLCQGSWTERMLSPAADPWDWLGTRIYSSTLSRGVDTFYTHPEFILNTKAVKKKKKKKSPIEGCFFLSHVFSAGESISAPLGNWNGQKWTFDRIDSSGFHMVITSLYLQTLFWTKSTVKTHPRHGSPRKNQTETKDLLIRFLRRHHFLTALRKSIHSL